MLLFYKSNIFQLRELRHREFKYLVRVKELRRGRTGNEVLVDRLWSSFFFLHIMLSFCTTVIWLDSEFQNVGQKWSIMIPQGRHSSWYLIIKRCLCTYSGELQSLRIIIQKRFFGLMNGGTLTML